MSLDELLGSLEEQAKLTDEELLKKYESIFNFEFDFQKAVKESSAYQEEKEEETLDPENVTAEDDQVQISVKKIKEKKAKKKKLDQEELKKLMLDDAALLE